MDWTILTSPVQDGVQMQPCPREGHCSCVIGSSVYVFGGVSITGDKVEELADLWNFSTESKQWTEIKCSGEKPLSRCAATMTAVDTKLYIFGGLNQSAGWLDDLFVFDTETNTWFEEDEYSGSMPSARDKLSSCAVGKNIYFFGGFGMLPRSPLDAEDEEDEYDSADEVKTLEANQEAAQFGWFDDLYVYDTVNKVWSSPMQMSLGKPSPRCASSMISLGKTIVIFGGRDADGRQNDLHFFDTQSKKWLKDRQIKGRAPDCRSYHTAAVIGQNIYLFGGRGLEDQHYQDLHVLNTENNTWTQLSCKNIEARGCHTMVACSDSLYVFGGSSKFNPTLQQCEKFYGDLQYVTVKDLLNIDGQSPKKMKE